MSPRLAVFGRTAADDVGASVTRAIKAGLLEGTVEVAPCGTKEPDAILILQAAGGFANDQDSTPWAVREYNLNSVGCQLAAPALSRVDVQ